MSDRCAREGCGHDIEDHNGPCAVFRIPAGFVDSGPCSCPAFEPERAPVCAKCSFPECDWRHQSSDRSPPHWHKFRHAFEPREQDEGTPFEEWEPPPLKSTGTVNVQVKPREAAGAGPVNSPCPVLGCEGPMSEYHAAGHHYAPAEAQTGAGEGGEHGDKHMAADRILGRSSHGSDVDPVEAAPLTPADVERWERRAQAVIEYTADPNRREWAEFVIRLCAEVRRLAARVAQEQVSADLIAQRADRLERELADTIARYDRDAKEAARSIETQRERAEAAERELQRERTSAENLARLNLYERVVAAEAQAEAARGVVEIASHLGIFEHARAKTLNCVSCERDVARLDEALTAFRAAAGKEREK